MTKFFELLFAFMTQFPLMSFCFCAVICLTIIATCALIFHRPSQTHPPSGYDDIDDEDTDIDIEDLTKNFEAQWLAKKKQESEEDF